MPVEIKLLKGFSNPINNESNTLSLLVKSDYELNEHLHESKQKLVISLTSIINHLKDAQEINFYHKLIFIINYLLSIRESLITQKQGSTKYHQIHWKEI